MIPQNWVGHVTMCDLHGRAVINISLAAIMYTIYPSIRCIESLNEHLAQVSGLMVTLQLFIWTNKKYVCFRVLTTK